MKFCVNISIQIYTHAAAGCISGRLDLTLCDFYCPISRTAPRITAVPGCGNCNPIPKQIRPIPRALPCQRPPHRKLGVRLIQLPSWNFLGAGDGTRELAGKSCSFPSSRSLAVIDERTLLRCFFSPLLGQTCCSAQRWVGILHGSKQIRFEFRSGGP